MSIQWFLKAAPHVEPRSRLFCLPYAGGSAAIYRGWRDLLPADIEVLPVQLAGRGWRMRETPVSDVHRLAGEIASAMQPLLDRPFAVFGHSMGSWLGLEVLRRLEEWGHRAECFFASGRQAPSLGSTQGPMTHLDDDGFVGEVQLRYGGIPAEILSEPDVLALLLPALRADIAALEHYRYAPGPRLHSPIVALVGNRDHLVPATHLAPWALETSGPFSVHTLAGGHFYFQPDPRELLRVVRRTLRAPSWTDATIGAQAGAEAAEEA